GWAARDKVLRRAEVIGGKAVDLTISFADRALIIEGTRDSAELRAKMTRMFQLHVDMSDFVALTRNSPSHEWVERSGFGRLLCGSTLFEDVVKIIATTNTMWRQTMRMTELLVEKCGKRTRAGRKAFPIPADVARFSVGELQEDCRLGYRAKPIHALANGIVDGTIDM